MTAPSDWVPAGVLPFSVEQPDEAVDRLLEQLPSTVELLGFGEALHGGQDILLLRNRLFRRLVEKHGFTAIALESSFERGELVQRFVTGSGPEHYADIEEDGFSHGYGRVRANRELVEWMRAYNESATRPVHFYGCDMPGGTVGPASPRRALRLVMDLLGTSPEQRERVELRLCHDESWEDPGPWCDPQQAAPLVAAVRLVHAEVEALISELRVRRPAFLPETYAEALHQATASRELINFFYALSGPASYADSLAVRDVMMADNLAYILERERRRGKVLVFAHNGHLQRGKVEMPIGGQSCSWWPAGSHLHASLGARYAVVGTAVGTSRGNGIGVPEPDTLEARLIALPGPARFVPTAGVQGGGALPRSRSAKNASYSPLSEQSWRDFDWLAVLDSTSYAAGAYNP
jgi:erythromycin esterase